MKKNKYLRYFPVIISLLASVFLFPLASLTLPSLDELSAQIVNNSVSDPLYETEELYPWNLYKKAGEYKGSLTKITGRLSSFNGSSAVISSTGESYITNDGRFLFLMHCSYYTSQRRVTENIAYDTEKDEIISILPDDWDTGTRADRTVMENGYEQLKPLIVGMRYYHFFPDFLNDYDISGSEYISNAPVDEYVTEYNPEEDVNYFFSTHLKNQCLLLGIRFSVSSVQMTAVYDPESQSFCGSAVKP